MSSNSSEYAFVQKSALKLKGVQDKEIKKKKKKKKSHKSDRKEESASVDSSKPSTSGPSTSSSSEPPSETDAFYRKMTKSEIAFLKRKEERDVQRIREKAKVSHKERVEKFNSYLDSLSEHYEPAKVSWTK